MKNMLKLWLTLLVLTSVVVAEAQNMTVKGKMTDNEGSEVLGASIMIKG